MIRRASRATTREPRSAAGFYVYALLDVSLRPPRIKGHRIEVVPVRGLFAAIERLSLPPAITEQSLRTQHDIVLKLARRARAILPVRFGALLDAGELARIIGLRAAALRKALRAVRGKDQMTIRVFGPPVPRRRQPSPRTGTSYLLARAAAVRVEVPPSAKVIQEVVTPIVSAERVDTGRSEGAVTINHLVERRSVARYRRAVRTALSTMPDAPPIVMSGPWPPFAFAPDLWEQGEDAT